MPGDIPQTLRMSVSQCGAVKKTVPAGQYHELLKLAEYLYGLCDVSLDDKTAAKWALDRAVTLRSQLRFEAAAVGGPPNA